MEELLKLAKQCLSIVETATLKDDEIKMLIASAIADLNRQGIKVTNLTSNALIQSAIMMFVKANFGNVDIREKELAQRTYGFLCANLGLSEEYMEENNA